MKKSIWITWEIQRRNIGISSALGWPLHEIVVNNRGILRYIKSSLKTIQVIINEKPHVVVTQNPSILLTFLVILVKHAFGYKVIVDAHNSGIYPLEGRSKLLMIFSRWLQRNADLTLVTNESLRSVVESNNGQAFVLPDRIPSPAKPDPFPLDGRVNIAFICKFGNDEPYEEVIRAGGDLPADVFIYITGKYDGKVNLRSLTSNVKLLGFLPEKEYWSLLSSADVIMDLTLREDCLVCGAYEGVALGKPLVLSDTQALRSYFSKGCIYVSSNSHSIASGIKRAIQERTSLFSEVKMLRDLLNQKWFRRLKILEERLDAM